MFLSTKITPIFTFFSFFISRTLSPIFFKSYKDLSIKDRYNWDSRYGSQIYAFFVLYCVSIMWDETDFKSQISEVDEDFTCKESIIFTETETSRWVMEISMVYFITDAFICWFYKISGLEILFHHFIVSFGVFFTLYEKKSQFMISWLLFSEGTTFFVNNRWWLYKMKMHNTFWYKINAMCLLISWLFCRLFPIFFYYKHMINDYHKYKYAIIPFYKLLLFILPSFLGVLNLYWFLLILRGFNDFYKKIIKK